MIRSAAFMAKCESLAPRYLFFDREVEGVLAWFCILFIFSSSLAPFKKKVFLQIASRSK